MSIIPASGVRLIRFIGFAVYIKEQAVHINLAGIFYSDLLFLSYRAVIYAHFYILVIVSEVPAVYGQPADMSGVVGNGQLEPDGIPVIKLQIL